MNGTTKDTALRERLEAGAPELGVPLEPAAADALLELLGLLERWNRAYNPAPVPTSSTRVPCTPRSAARLSSTCFVSASAGASTAVRL